MGQQDLPAPHTVRGASPIVILTPTNEFSADAEQMASTLRRMGLRPEAALEAPADFTAATLGPVWRLGFGDTDFVFALLDPFGWLADTAAPENSQSAGSRPDGGSPVAPSWALMPLAEGAPVEPVTAVRHFFKVAVLLVDLLAAGHVFWSPARLWSEAASFRLAVSEMLDSGMPPLLHLVSFRGGGDEAGMDTKGLAHFCGQELRLDDAGGLDRAGQVRRLARLAIDMMLNGPVQVPRRFAGMVADEWLDLDADEAGDGTLLIVRIIRE